MGGAGPRPPSAGVPEAGLGPLPGSDAWISDVATLSGVVQAPMAQP